MITLEDMYSRKKNNNLIDRLPHNLEHINNWMEKEEIARSVL